MFSGSVVLGQLCSIVAIRHQNLPRLSCFGIFKRQWFAQLCATISSTMRNNFLNYAQQFPLRNAPFHKNCYIYFSLIKPVSYSYLSGEGGGRTYRQAMPTMEDVQRPNLHMMGTLFLGFGWRQLFDIILLLQL